MQVCLLLTRFFWVTLSSSTQKKLNKLFETSSTNLCSGLGIWVKGKLKTISSFSLGSASSTSFCLNKFSYDLKQCTINEQLKYFYLNYFI